MTAYLPFYAHLPLVGGEGLLSGQSRAVLNACSMNKAFEVIELRQDRRFDVIIVDCLNDAVPTRNTVGIRPRERLALIVYEDDMSQPEVRALRVDFPLVPHMLHAEAGQPRSLCLYFGPWERARRTWTAQKHLQRILMWLLETSTESLHRDDQPLEQVYYNSRMELVLPADFDHRVSNSNDSLALAAITRRDGRLTIRAEFGTPQADTLVPLILHATPVVHGRVDEYPTTLGGLRTQLASRGVSLDEPLSAAVRSKVPVTGVKHVPSQMCFLVLHLPLQRAAGKDAETVDRRGFAVHASLAELGKRLGVLQAVGDKYHAPHIIGQEPTPETSAWHDVVVEPVEVRPATTPQFARRLSGIPEDGASQERILAGVGALGSAMANLWAREAWGRWTFVDPDYVKPHNVIRHLARDYDIGHYKTDVVRRALDSIYPGAEHAKSIAYGLLVARDEVAAAVRDATLIVDATTSLEVPRELSRRDVARSVSVFVTPQGRDSVLLLEDASRRIRLESVEAQYYFAILNSAWGDRHLKGHGAASLGIGAGCRDVSFVMSEEIIELHASILAKQVRQLSAQDSAVVRVWSADATTGSVAAFDVPVTATVEVPMGEWRVVSHAALESKLREMRREKLPRETGGVILGYVDHVAKSIFVVDVLAAPPDSIGDESGFIRGAEGLQARIADASERTARIVQYIGEWHSHPPMHGPRPSFDDLQLMGHLAVVLKEEGEPALMVIVGESGEMAYMVCAEADDKADAPLVS
jgi:integrative and conjugative element protein (TIGR02256 family)